MRFRVTIGFLALAVCLWNVVVCSSAESQDKLKTLTDKSLRNAYKDVLDIPAMMSPLAEKNWLTGIALAGERIVAVGIRGHILYSDDKGKTWVQSKVPVSVDLTAVYFPTPKKGWVVGHDGLVLHTTDGGTSWIKQLDGYGACRIMGKYYKDHALSGKLDKEAADKLRGDIQFLAEQGPVNPFLDVWFENENVGFVIGAFNMIFRTTDGGKSWEPWLDRTENPMSLHLYCVRPAGKDIYICGEQGLVLKLDRQANRFKLKQTPYMGTYFGILGTDKVLVAFGMRGNIYCSRNGGESWQQVKTDVKAGILAGIQSTNGDMILVAQDGNILVSQDGAKSFMKVNSGVAAGLGVPLNAVVVAGSETLVMASALGVKVQKIK